MSKTIRGADLVARVLASAGVGDIYSLSGNHIMPLYDALFDTKAHIIHTRHEAAAVHMADAHARLTGNVGVALVTGGQGHTNAVAALTTAQCAEAPVLLLSGHAPIKELGRGAFQELRQVDLAAPVTKHAWMVERTENLGHDLAKAMRVARSGRPGPVHLSLPTDVLEATLEDDPRLWPRVSDFAAAATALSAESLRSLVEVIRSAKRPLLLAGPSSCTSHRRRALADAEAALGVPAIGMESPRGINDPVLGDFADVLKSADLIVLIGKPHDFTLRFCAPPFVAADARIAIIDPEPEMLARAAREHAAGLAFSAQADATRTFEGLAMAAQACGDAGWYATVQSAITYRPATWETATGAGGKLHPAAMMRPLARLVEANPEAIFISDGGEIGQWAQACVASRRRVINGVAGSIGAALPFALAARVVEKKAPIITVMGDGTFGFHMAEVETAVRHGLPFVCVIGNDARWNAEHQIQLREYGAQRAHSCSLAPTRYDQVAVALGGHGEFVTAASELEPAVSRALTSGKPSVVNVMIDGLPAPAIRRS